MGLRFNPPPGWPPPPPGFVPPPGWQPDPSWPPPPPGWQLMVPDDTPGARWSPPGETQEPGWGQAPQAYPYGSQFPRPGGVPPAGGTNGFAIASFVLGLLGLTIIGIVLGVIFGVIALSQIRSRPQRGKGLAIAGLVLSGCWILLIGGLIALGASVKPSSGSGGVAHRARVNVFSLRAGNCFQNPPAGQTLQGVTYVTVVPCTTRHNAQVFVEFRAAGGSGYPGQAALQRQADAGCRARIAGHLDRSKITSSMSLHYLYPLAGSWADGHRTITCLIVDTSAGLTSSLLVSAPATG